MSKKCKRTVKAYDNSLICHLFVEPMKSYAYIILVVLVILNFSSCKQDDSPIEITKIALRDVGHTLLLSNQDSTSLVLPVTKVDAKTYKISFQQELSIQPDSLVIFVKNSLEKAKLANHYRVEVFQCKVDEVAYSYEINQNEAESIIPCAGRILPLNCYTIKIRFETNQKQSSLIYLWLIVPLLLVLGFLFRQKKTSTNPTPVDQLCYNIGNYKFDKDQSKLLYIEKEIGLSKKECELLEILCDNLNEVVKRDELSKRVWEDHGVFVGRSLDTYISKLRKKLKEDTSIKIANVHGIGYKLEVSKE
ncbi:winged helix-turn-helix domain-containing protein [Psychroserpens ponticola]|uniref:Winged helix-turn-helix domain-containing protein n=1 Tax=Psychroserpens ponticola TaxID=2932268 RepID=A0ABY7RWJ0_9FLAO|nr:winged helix-turn-helix domain-containing protein [Psychroserpens ponticola]WCO01514.1 winged helix-turn-helix domain-containing protein [Psychroserpens ponticola]